MNRYVLFTEVHESFLRSPSPILSPPPSSGHTQGVSTPVRGAPLAAPVDIGPSQLTNGSIVSSVQPILFEGGTPWPRPA
ncbi:hypothetical protein PAPYR_8190 [Paratrimastix pyriformis]|uniref:Uncharacterized protein n=1 Tax=Paratrimastix pyriformis TaxID=342808 RepID=A0ABQ8UDM7_9EUKA|nr:hypothetical protein PAPYR_8190 [Paratrimastix pyriformis]